MTPAFPPRTVGPVMRDGKAVPPGHVAIDGPVGSGKTTVARRLSRKMGLLYLDSGAMYRAVAWRALADRIDPDDEAALVELVRRFPFSVRHDPNAPLGFRLFAGSTELGTELYANDVSALASVVATHAGVRELLVERQQAIAREGPVVMAGRDIGTVVLPEAPVKVFLTASVDARAGRRLAELRERGITIDPLVLRAQIVERDRLDATRAVAPLVEAPGALVLDSSDLSIDAVVEQICSYARAVRSA